MVVTPLRTLVAAAWWRCRMTTRTRETRRRGVDVTVNRARRAAGARGGTRRAVGANPAVLARRAARALTVPARGTGRAGGLACAGVRASAAWLARRARVGIGVNETGMALGTGQPQGVARAPRAAAKARCAGVEVNVHSAVGTANATQSVLRESWIWAYVRPLSSCRC